MLPGAAARLLGPHRPLQVVRAGGGPVPLRFGFGSGSPSPAHGRRPRRDAWHSLGTMSKEEAMAAYVAEMKKVAQKVTGRAAGPGWALRGARVQPRLSAGH